MVNELPENHFQSQNSQIQIAVGAPVDFTGSCTDTENYEPDSFLWHFGEAAQEISSTQQNPQGAQFQAPSEYIVSFLCRNALSVANPITPRPRYRCVQLWVSLAVAGVAIVPDDQLSTFGPLQVLGNSFLPLVVLFVLLR